MTDAGLRERTFLTTDVQGSTALHRRFPGDILKAMDLHDEILHGAIRRHAGDPFRHTGDGLIALFDHPADAVRAVASALIDMRGADWGVVGQLRIRSGIHTGLSRPRGADYFGPAMSVVNRLEGAASVDQILLSQAAVNRIGESCTDAGFGLLDLGEYHFKGIEPTRVYQAVVPGLPKKFAPLGGKREPVGGNLPASISTFLGRQSELSELREQLEKTRLLNLLGPGGIGKTRLGLELARSVVSAHLDGVWMVNLSSLKPGDDVWPAIAGALSLPPLQSVEPSAQVLDRLRGADALLLIDSCEHLRGEVADAVTALGRGCSQLKILCTSRRLLGVPGESIYEVPSLAPQTHQSIAESTAVQLFTERAQKVNRRFRPSAVDKTLIGEICATLEYLPLTIEIAASQLRRFSLNDLLDRAANPLDLATAGARRLSVRQQSLRDTLEWSYDLLGSGSRGVWANLSVFAGSIHEDLGVTVCADIEGGVAEVLDSIEELIDSSLLTVEGGNSRRYRMLDSVQAFGREKLGDKLAALEQRYCRVFADRCQELSVQFAGAEEGQAMTTLYDELPNLRSAFERAMLHQPALAEELTEPLFLFNYFHRGAESGKWGRRIVDQGIRNGREYSPLLLTAAATHALHISGDPTLAACYVNRALSAEEEGLTPTHGWCASVAGQVAMWSGRPQDSIRYHTAAIAQARAGDNHACEILSMALVPAMQARVGDLAAARATVQQLAERESEVVQPSLIGYIHHACGQLASVEGNTSTALQHYNIALEHAIMGGNHQGVERIKRHIADIRANQVGPAQAVQIQMETLVAFPGHGDTVHAWWVIRCLLEPLAALGRDDEVILLAGALQASLLRLDRTARESIGLSQQRMTESRFTELRNRGAKMTLPDVREYLVQLTSGNSPQI